MSILDTITINGQPISTGMVVTDWFEWQALEITCPAQPGIVGATLSVNNVPLGPPATMLGDTLWRWHWNPQHAVGQYQASMELRHGDGTRISETFRLRIVPRKLDIECYEALLAAIQRDARAIVYAIHGGQQGAVLQPTLPQTLVEEYHKLVQGHVAEALKLVQQIGARPQQQLIAKQGSTQLGQLERLDPSVLAALPRTTLDDVAEDVLPALQAALRPPAQRRGGPLPRLVPTPRSVATHDIVEHRVLQQVLHGLQWRVGHVRELTRHELQRRERNAELVDSLAAAATMQAWLEGCQEALRRLRQALAVPWLAGVGEQVTLHGPTQLMRREPRYRRLFALYQALRSTPLSAVELPALWLPIHDLPTLYEQWCALQVVQTLLPHGEVAAQQLVEAVPNAKQPTQTRLTVRLQHHQPLLELRLPNQTRLVVWYQRRFEPQPTSTKRLGSLDPFVRIPDIAVEVVRPGTEARVLVFDAKYRVAADGSIPQDALDDAYAYRSAIGVGAARATLGAYLLFPGTRALATADQVGALPLLPGQTTALDELIRSILLT